MFDAVRSKRWFVQIFLILIALSFALWGVESYVRNMGAGDDVAAVGDSKITQQQFQQALREQQDQLRNMLGDAYKPAMFDSPEARRSVLEQLINQRLLLIEAAKGRMGISEAQLQELIRSIPSLQDNGQFSMAKYEAMVRAQGFSIPGFEAQLRQDLVVQQLAGGIGESAVLSNASFDGLHALLAEERQVAESRIAPDAFLAKVTVGDEAVKAYYDGNPREFQVPEQLRAQYAVLSLDAMKGQLAVSAEEIRSWYETHKDKYQQPEERRASHILIAADAKGPAADRAKAKAKAEELLAKLKTAPADFAKLAREFSQDPGSAESGGDLGFFARGMMVKPFEDTVFSLKQGELSGIVETDFGYHIITLAGIKPGKVRPLEEVRPEIEAELRQQSVTRLYAQAAETFANTVYEQAESLQPVADQFKLKLEESGWLIKGAAPQGTGPLANGKLYEALFGDDAVKNKRNTEAVEVAPNTLVSARVLEHKPATVKPFEAVRGEIHARLVRQEAAKLAQQAGEAKLAELRQGNDAGLAWSAPKSVSRLSAARLGPQAGKAVFSAPVGKLPAYAGIAQADGSYALYKIVAVNGEARLPAQQVQALREQVVNMQAQADFAAYLAGLRQRYQIDINTEKLETRL